MKYLIALLLVSFSCFSTAANLPELPKELLIQSNLKPGVKAKASAKKTSAESTADQYFSCSATRQSDLVGLPNRTLILQFSKNAVFWIESKKSYNLRVEEFEYLVGDSKEGFIVNRIDGQVDYLIDNKTMHGICKAIDKPVVAF